LLVSLRHGDEVTAVAFSPDGRLLVSADYLQKVYLWGIRR
jgi:WD40 repeat protein